MAVGRKDYFWGVAPEKSVFGELQTQFQRITAGEITGLNDADFFDYPVPGGYILNLTGLILGSRISGITQWYVYEDATLRSFGYFDTHASIVFGEGGVIVLEPGSVLKVTLYNWMDYDIFYSLNAYGFMQQIIV